ncbi:hypothetical protein F5Y04DRAFT_257784 [Hypomontagnella monticulosa]|nr:hypothetical protein F5Y04DRAFT_257784 [Hypomontagnella monticulosa]
MKVTAIVSALFISMVAATPAANPGSEGIYPFDKRDITPEGLWKRDCPGSEVPNPLCPYGQFRVSSKAKCVALIV